MRVALVVPGGVDQSGEYRVIPAFVSLIGRLATRVELHVFALEHLACAGRWELAGAPVQNTGRPFVTVRTSANILRDHRKDRFALLHALFSGRCGFATALAARAARIPYAVHLAGGEFAAVPAVGYGGMLKRRWRVLEPWTLRGARVVSAASRPIIDAAAALGVNARRIPLGVDLSRWPASAPVPRAARVKPGSCTSRASMPSRTNRPCSPRSRNSRAMASSSRSTSSAKTRCAAPFSGKRNGSAWNTACGFTASSHKARARRPIVQAAHVHIVSSRHEAGPLALLEAAVSGVPTVGTAVGHLREWSPDAAVTVPPGDAAALAAAIDAVLSDEPRRLALAFEAQRRAMEIDADETARRFSDMYTEIAAG